MTAFTDAIVHPNITRVFLAEVTAGEHLTFWTLNSGSTWYATTTSGVTEVKQNGASLTVQTSIANVDANPGSFFYEQSTGRVYVQTTDSTSPYTKTIQAGVIFYFGSEPKIFNDDYYEPLLKDIPNLSLRIEHKFTGISQIGGGNMTLINADGFFDALTDLQWDAGSAVLLFGVDRKGQPDMAYGDYVTVGKWEIKDWTKSDTMMSLKLSEFKGCIKNKVPYTFYDRATYPNMLQDDVGKAIQIAYGKLKDITPVLIDVAARKFKVAGHAIISFDAVQVKNPTTETWEQKSFATTDLANGEFTMSSADWGDDKEISADFTGRVKSGVIPMDNASDIVKDLLTTYLGVPAGELNATTFTESYNKLDSGVLFNSTIRRTRGALAVYLDAPREVRLIVETINKAIGSYLLSDSAGKFYYRVFEPAVGEGLTTIDTAEIQGFSEVTVNREVISKINTHFDHRPTQEWSESTVFEILERQYIHAENAPVLRDVDVPLSEKSDAEQFGQAQLNYEGRPEKRYMLTIPSRLIATNLPGDLVRLVYARHGLNDVMELLETANDLTGDKTTLVLGDLHGIGDRSGFWVGDADALPTRFAGLAGYGAGSIVWNSTWHADIKAWARQNVGYWTDDNGLADSTDPDSLIPSTWV